VPLKIEQIGELARYKRLVKSLCFSNLENFLSMDSSSDITSQSQPVNK
jgi:hypothetical protein